jgi:RNA polymerase sigma-70 factor (ECF subfamily)
VDVVGKSSTQLKDFSQSHDLGMVNETENTTSEAPERWVSTRRTLVERLRNWSDQESWREFFNTYWKLIYAVALKSRLTDHEAEEVVQETVISVAKKMPEFRYDPEVCSFKGWLMRLTAFRILDQLRKRDRAAFAKCMPARDPGSTATIDRVPDPASLKLDTIWDEEWEKNLVDAALEKVKLQIQPQHYQIFYLSAVKGLKAGQIARMLNLSTGRVYLAKHRVGALVKQEIERLRKREL